MTIVRQLSVALSTAPSGDAKTGWLKQSELQVYKLNPVEVILERRVILADARYWVLVMPDDVAPCLEPSKSWRSWAFELSHWPS